LSPRAALRTALLTLVLAAAAWPAAADITVITHYTFINGDTLTRPSFYSTQRVRVTAPDGTEFMFNSRGDTVTVIDHKAKTFWKGPRKLADSLADLRIMKSRKEVGEMLRQNQELWAAKVDSFNKSIHVSSTHRTRKIAGYPCDEWIVEAGRNMTSQRWIARSLAVVNFGPELQKTVLASVADPLGRVLMRMTIASREKPGLPLSGRTTFQTPTQKGSFSFDALKVIGAKIPKSAWQVPAGYTEIKL